MAPPSVAPGRRSFRFRRRIGKGAFGEVYLAELVTAGGFSKVVAVKLLKPEFSDERDIVSRMRDEARLLGHLRHPAIVQADDLTLLGGRIAIVMEYVPGANLLSLILPRVNPEPVPPVALAAIVGRVAEALEAAWSRPSTLTGEPLRVLHRDIKPSNIRITPDGEVKVLDFGVARADAMERETTTHNQLVGSLTFLGPEVFLCQPLLPGTDIYALGVTFYESLARARLGRCGLTPEQHRDLVMPRIAALDLGAWGAAAPAVRALLADMLAFEVVRRPTAAHVARTCRQLCAGLPGPDLREWARQVVDRVGRADQEDPDGELVGATLDEDSTPRGGVSGPWGISPDDVTETAPRPSRRGWYLAAALAALVLFAALGALGAGVAWFLGRAPASAPAPAQVAAPAPVAPEPAAAEPAPLADPAPPAPDPVAVAAPAPRSVARAAIREAPRSVPVRAEPRPAPAAVEPRSTGAVAESAEVKTAATGSASAVEATIKVSGPRRSLRNSRLSVTIELTDPGCRPTVFWRVEDGAAWEVATPTGGGPIFTWSLDVIGEHRPALLYYVTAAPCGLGEGSAERPIRVAVI